METASLIIKVDSSGADRATKSLDNLDNAAGGSERAAHKLGKAWGIAIGTISVAAIAGATSAYLRQADAMANLSARLGLVTDSSDALAKAQRDVFDIAQRTATDLEATADLYTKLAQSSDELRGNQKLLAMTTETVSKALVVSGADAASTTAVIRQFSQAMASGALRGDEFISVMEGAPRLARAIADGLGVPIGKLRELAAQGDLTAERIIAALENQSEAVDREFGKMPMTVARATEKVENALQRLIGKTDDTSNASASLAIAISDMADVLGSDETLQAAADAATAIAKVGTAAVTATAKVAGFIKEYRGWLADRGFVPGEELGQLKARRAKMAEMVEVSESQPTWLGSDRNIERMKAELAEIDRKIAEYPFRAVTSSVDSTALDKEKKPSATMASLEKPKAHATREATEAVKELSQAEQEAAWIEAQWDESAMAAHNRRVTAWAAEGDAAETATGRMITGMDLVTARATDAFADGFTDALFAIADGSKTASEAFNDMATSIVKDLASMIIKMTVYRLIAGAMGVPLDASMGMGMPYGGGRATGGPVNRGGLYEVTEGGKSELLQSGGKTYLIPGTSGTVIPATTGGKPGVAGSGMKVEINNYGNDKVQAREETQQMPDGSTLSRMIIDVVANDVASGGRVVAAGKSRLGWREAV